MQILSIPLRTLVVATTFGLMSLACPWQKHEDMRPIGPAVNASLVIYFKARVTEKEISHFLEETLTYPDPQGRGHHHKDGVGTILRVNRPVQGHEAIAVTFFENATHAQRGEIKSAVLASPIVYKILDNVAPAEVKKID
ncbi:MAG: hypothetical protein ACR2G5_01610 [Pyrinomonadaceae bacterium]